MAVDSEVIEKKIDKSVLDIATFNDIIVGAYNDGTAEDGLEADEGVARSLIPAGTGSLRDFSYISPEIPILIPEACVGCMDCVTECPDTAILGKVIRPKELETATDGVKNKNIQKWVRDQFSETNKYYNVYEKKGQDPGVFGIFIDPTKCKGCAECVEACGDHGALKMIFKNDENMVEYSEGFKVYQDMPATKPDFINEKILPDMMLADESLLYVGGAGSCMGCGEATVLRMMLAATGFVYGKESIGLVASTGCNTVYGSTYPYNPFLVPWTNSLFENGAADAMGVRAMWDQKGWTDKKLWVIGGDGAMLDIGFQALSRMMASGMNINVLILDTQVYSNTGGQASTGTYMSQEAKMSAHGKAIKGKTERRKEIGNIAMMHPNVYVAQTTAAHTNHFYKTIMAANEFPGPAIINTFTTCQPEHGVADDMAGHQAKLAVNSRAFPLFVHDPRIEGKLSDRLSLASNPAIKDDWYKNPKTGELIDFVYFARTEGRFSKQFDKDGKPSEALLAANEDRLQNWRLLQELAGII